ncbi:MAG TPA: N-acetylmuramoyl-L-alanine amidase, partial [Rubricoccaceae bacterium]
MPVVLLVVLLSALVASPAEAASLDAVSRPAAAVQAIAFEPQAGALTVRIRTTARVESFRVEQSGRTVRLVLAGASMAPEMDRGRAAPPVRDYRVEAERERVTLTFDAPGSPLPVATRDARTSDVLLTFGNTPAPTAARMPTTRRAAGWGRAPEADAPAATPPAQTPRAETPRERTIPETPRVETPIVAAPRRAPTRRSRVPAPAETAPAAPNPAPTGEAPAASAWQTAPPVVVPYTPEASAVYVANGNNWRLDTIVLDAGHGGHDIGATYNGVREKDVTLGIVRALGP